MTTTAAITSTLGKLDYVPAPGWRFDVRFDFADATWRVFNRPDKENSVSFHEELGNAKSFTLPANTDASMFEGWAAEIMQPLLDRIKAGYSTEWTRGSRVAVYSADAISEKEQIDYLLAHNNYSMAAIPRLGDWQGRFDAEEYLWEVRNDLIEDYGITAEINNEQLFGIADKINTDHLKEYAVLEGTADYLLKLRDNLREETMHVAWWRSTFVIDKNAPAKEKDNTIMTTTLTPYVTPKQNNFTRLMDDAEAAADQAFISANSVRKLMHETLCAAPEGYQDSSEGQEYQDAIDRMDTVLFALRAASDKLTGTSGYLAELPNTLPKAR